MKTENKYTCFLCRERRSPDCPFYDINNIKNRYAIFAYLFLFGFFGEEDLFQYL